MSELNILDQYVSEAPNDQAALNLFAGEWSSALPASHGHLQAGHAALFEDPRVKWALEQIGGIQGGRVLEFGPLEGGHSYMLERAGAAQVLAVEANTRAYLKCLIVKEIMGLTRTRFQLGDFMAMLRDGAGRFDFAVASGVLYHMRTPLELLGRLARTSDRIFLWTHYYDAGVIGTDETLSAKFVEDEEQEYDGYTCTVHKQLYAGALGWQGFCGGGAEYSYWTKRADILGMLEHSGFKDIRVGHEQRDHPNGPAFCVVAQR